MSGEIPSMAEIRRDEARKGVESVRPRCLQRLIAADEAVAYAESEETALWREYVREREESTFPPMKDEFLEYLGPERFRRLLLEDAGAELYSEEERREWFDVSDRTLTDCLLVLEHLYSG